MLFWLNLGKIFLPSRNQVHYCHCLDLELKQYKSKDIIQVLS